MCANSIHKGKSRCVSYTKGIIKRRQKLLPHHPLPPCSPKQDIGQKCIMCNLWSTPACKFVCIGEPKITKNEYIHFFKIYERFCELLVQIWGIIIYPVLQNLWEVLWVVSANLGYNNLICPEYLQYFELILGWFWQVYWKTNLYKMPFTFLITLTLFHFYQWHAVKLTNFID